MREGKNPTGLPAGWPMDGRSKFKDGVLRHPERDAMEFKEGKWQLWDKQEAA